MITVYLDTSNSILLKSNDKSFHLLYYILKQINSETLEWYADKINKEELMKTLDLKLITLDKQLQSLRERDLLLKTNLRGKYKLNEEIFTI